MPNKFTKSGNSVFRNCSICFDFTFRVVSDKIAILRLLDIHLGNLDLCRKNRGPILAVKTTHGTALKKMLVISNGSHHRPLEGILKAGAEKLLLAGINYDFSRIVTAEKLAEKQRYDLIMFKIDNTDDAVAELVQKIHQIRPTTPLLFLSMQENNRNIVKILRSGADGYVQKEAIATELQNAIAYLLRGQKYIS